MSGVIYMYNNGQHSSSSSNNNADALVMDEAWICTTLLANISLHQYNTTTYKWWRRLTRPYYANLPKLLIDYDNKEMYIRWSLGSSVYH